MPGVMPRDFEESEPIGTDIVESSATKREGA
jgi:hypothetical protein